jgi:hypothetical protein
MQRAWDVGRLLMLCSQFAMFKIQIQEYLFAKELRLGLLEVTNPENEPVRVDLKSTLLVPYLYHGRHQSSMYY